MKALGRCVSCSQRLPVGRNHYCLLCKPTLDGKTVHQKRLARKRRDEVLEARNQRRRLKQNALIEIILSNIPNPGWAAIIRSRCGLNNDRDCALEEVGKRFGISRERVRQIEKQVLGMSIRKLRAYETVVLKKKTKFPKGMKPKVRKSKNRLAVKPISVNDRSRKLRSTLRDNVRLEK